MVFLSCKLFTLTASALLLAVGASQDREMFSAPWGKKAIWCNVNDNVMGGVSLGHVAPSPDSQTLHWSGDLTFDSNGGFVGFRGWGIKGSAAKFSMAPYTGIKLQFRGNSSMEDKVYRFTVQGDNLVPKDKWCLRGSRGVQVFYDYFMVHGSDELQTVYLAKDFQYRYPSTDRFHRYQDRDEVSSFGLGLYFQEGPFAVHVEAVAAVTACDHDSYPRDHPAANMSHAQAVLERALATEKMINYKADELGGSYLFQAPKALRAALAQVFHSTEPCVAALQHAILDAAGGIDSHHFTWHAIVVQALEMASDSHHLACNTTVPEETRIAVLDSMYCPGPIPPSPPSPPPLPPWSPRNPRIKRSPPPPSAPPPGMEDIFMDSTLDSRASHRAVAVPLLVVFTVLRFL